MLKQICIEFIKDNCMSNHRNRVQNTIRNQNIMEASKNFLEVPINKLLLNLDEF